MSTTQFGYIQPRVAKDQAPVFQSNPTAGTFNTINGAITIPCNWQTGITLQNSFVPGTQIGTIRYTGTENCLVIAACTGVILNGNATSGTEEMQLRLKSSSGTTKSTYVTPTGYRDFGERMPVANTGLFNVAPGDIIDVAYVATTFDSVMTFIKMSISIAAINN